MAAEMGGEDESSMSVCPKPAASGLAHNPILWADVPDIAMIRVEATYYMSSMNFNATAG